MLVWISAIAVSRCLIPAMMPVSEMLFSERRRSVRLIVNAAMRAASRLITHAMRNSPAMTARTASGRPIRACPSIRSTRLFRPPAPVADQGLRLTGAVLCPDVPKTRSHQGALTPNHVVSSSKW